MKKSTEKTTVQTLVNAYKVASATKTQALDIAQSKKESQKICAELTFNFFEDAAIRSVNAESLYNKAIKETREAVGLDAKTFANSPIAKGLRAVFTTLSLLGFNVEKSRETFTDKKIRLTDSAKRVADKIANGVKKEIDYFDKISKLVENAEDSDSARFNVALFATSDESTVCELSDILGITAEELQERVEAYHQRLAVSAKKAEIERLTAEYTELTKGAVLETIKITKSA